MVVNESVSGHYHSIATLLNAFDMIRKTRVDALPEPSNVLSVLW